MTARPHASSTLQPLVCSNGRIPGERDTGCVPRKTADRKAADRAAPIYWIALMRLMDSHEVLRDQNVQLIEREGRAGHSPSVCGRQSDDASHEVHCRPG